MQRKIDADKALHPGRNASTKMASPSSDAVPTGPPQIVFLEGEGNPLIRHCPGRRSFGKFNPAMEDYALIQIKAFRKFVKDAGRAAPAGTAAAAAAAAAAGKSGRVGTGTCAERIQEEGKDVSDQAMAAALRH